MPNLPSIRNELRILHGALAKAENELAIVVRDRVGALHDAILRDEQVETVVRVEFLRQILEGKAPSPEQFQELGNLVAHADGLKPVPAAEPTQPGVVIHPPVKKTRRKKK